MVPVTGVYLETGTKRVFACAVDWPGWCRPGRGEEQALVERPFPAGDLAAVARIRATILAEIRAAAAAGVPEDPGRGRRPARFVARRAAWHALDHAWEIQDKAPAT